MKTYGYLRQDDDGHWYLIPEDKVKRFKELMDKIEKRTWNQTFDEWEGAVDEFIYEFDEYRLSGGPYDLKIEIEG